MTQSLLNAQRDLLRRRTAPQNGHATNGQTAVNGRAAQDIRDIRGIQDITQALVAQAVGPKTPATAAPLVGRQLQRARLSDLDASHPKVAHAISMARAWASRKQAGVLDASLVLAGGNGTGKTHIARAIWWSIIQAALDDDDRLIPGTERPVGHFYHANDMVSILGTTRDPETGLVVPALASQLLGSAPLVIIDDVAAEQFIPFVSSDMQEQERHARYFKMLDYAYQRCSTIVTTNLTIPQLAAHIGRRAWDRLAEMAPRLPDGRSFMVDMFNVPSWRVRQGGR